MAIYSKLIEGLNNGDEMFVKVFTINSKGRVNNRVDLPYVICIPSAFPEEPSSYELIDTYTTATTFTAPEDGYYQIELFGASGNGANGNYSTAWDHEASSGNIYEQRWGVGGPGGGGGAVAISVVKLNKGDTIVLTSIAIGSTAAVYINSTIDVYSNMLCTSGGNATSPTQYNNGNTPISTNHPLYYGFKGTGGEASGGNVINLNGNAGAQGESGWIRSNNSAETYAGGAGGKPANVSGNYGGNGGSVTLTANSTNDTVYAYVHNNATSGKTAFMKIYRGNTNLA